nr:ABC transporter permease [Paenibacillus sp. GSMTC-2017]
MSWDQVRRRKVVTSLCAIGISIGCAAIIVAMSVGESAQKYIEAEMNTFFKMDEVTVKANEGVKGANVDAAELERGKLTDQKRQVIANFPEVKAVVPMLSIGYTEYMTADGKKANLELFATDLEQLENLGETIGQGSVTNTEGSIILSYGATMGLIDEKTRQSIYEQLENNPYDDDVMKQYNNLNSIPAALYQRQIQFNMHNNQDKLVTSSPYRVAGVLKKPDKTDELSISFDKRGYVSMETAEQLLQLKNSALVHSSGNNVLYDSLIVKVKEQKDVPLVEKNIKKLTLSASTNLHQKEQLASQFKIIKAVALGGGIFILIIASISIVVAMTMSTYQRRRQIGIMKVLGANLAQIRNMFIVEAALLGLLGGLLGVLFSHWVVWGINILIVSMSSGSAGAPTIFIPFNIIPIGMTFAIMTGVLSGIYPAINASRTDALTAIRRD